jgi:hypothetical protein
MANSDRKIIRGVVVGGTTYVSGKEDELDALLSSSEVKRLTAKGYIEGKWSGTAPEPEDKSKSAKKEK